MTDAATTATADALSPMQQRTLGLLRRTAEPVVFDAAFVASLRAEVEDAFAGFAERLGEETVFMSKHRLTSVLGCEVQHLLDDSFAWSPAVAGGQVAHRAIQLLLNWRGDPVPADVVEEAIARLANDDTSLGEWIAGLTEADLSDLRGFATDKLIKFQECFPPLDKRAAPTTESSVRWPLDGPIVLSGKVDLTIGRPTGAESRKVIIDLKTGWVSPKHREDLRFYALVETLRAQVPPRKLASFYLDAGDPVVEDVTERVLMSASRRMLDAVNAEIELRVEGRTPQKRPGVSCRWCAMSAECTEGTAYLAGRADDEDASRATPT
jgi:PD-(D/E)XK nuclease superfamily